MRVALFIFVYLALPPIAIGQITNYEVPGNLEKTAELSCMELSSAKNSNTPADLFPAVADCIAQGQYHRAVSLFALAGAFGRFDMMRVSDRTAHQAVSVLRLNTFGDITENRRAAFFEIFMEVYQTEGSEEKAALCEGIRTIGYPSYYPTYMIQHGMSAVQSALLGESEGSGLDREFDSRASWNETLSNYLHCSAGRDHFSPGADAK